MVQCCIYGNVDPGWNKYLFIKCWFTVETLRNVTSRGGQLVEEYSKINTHSFISENKNSPDSIGFSVYTLGCQFIRYTWLKKIKRSNTIVLQ